MALKLEPIRMLIADDVGIGKTIEAILIARELLDRGEIKRLTVLCPPHLAEQWQKELFEKFHIDAELVLSGTIGRLERDLPRNQSVFDQHPFTVVSTDFIKAPGRVEDFVRRCPECVIVDEAHGCTLAGGVGRGRQQRFELLRKISEGAERRHLILVTATPHSGNEDAFRSLLSLLDTSFADLPTDPNVAERAGIRRRLARHLVQRRRADISQYLETDTAFPNRRDKTEKYTFSSTYRKLFDDILKFAREYVTDDSGVQRQRRVLYWSALALLRCVSSSPAAAVATLRNRAVVDESDNMDVDEQGRRIVLDRGDEDDAIILDFSPGSDTEGSKASSHRKLREFARRAEAIKPADDHKLCGAVREIRALLKDGFHPVIFCRFVETAEYVARHSRDMLKGVRVEAVTGHLPPTERESRIASLVDSGGKFLLVCTDCLSEGINLQEHFDAVLHYDLAWNPTRHEQREGRVDRFGQPNDEVRVITWYGEDNPVDGVILDVLIRKHKNIKSTLGVTVAVPGSSEQIVETLFEGALFRESAGSGNSQQLSLDFIDDMDTQKQKLHQEWENASDREQASRSIFAQRTISPEAVAAELKSVRDAIGRSADVKDFFDRALRMAGVPITSHNGTVTVNLSSDAPRSLRQAVGMEDTFTGRFDLPSQPGDVYLGRTSPMVEGLAGWVLDQALDPTARETPVAARCGIMSTSEVDVRTTLLIVRFRYHLTRGGKAGEPMLGEEILPLACTGSAGALRWLTPERSEQLLAATPAGNLLPTAIQQQLDLLLPTLPDLQDALNPIANDRAKAQLEAHQRVREASRNASIKPVLPVDILGAFLFLPKL